MGRRKKTNGRGWHKTGMGVTQLVQGLDMGLKLALVSLPKSVYVYRTCIWNAIEGDFVKIDQAILALTTRIPKLLSTKDESPSAIRWKASMRDSYEGAYYVLMMYKQLMTEYYNEHPKPVKPVSSESVGEGDRKGNKVVRKQGVFTF